MRWSWILLILGAVLAYMGVQEWRLTSMASKTPEAITLKKLIERGPEGNPHIMLSEFLLGENFVFSSRSGRWTKVWVPIMAADDVEAVPGQPVKIINVRAIMSSTKVHDNNEIETRLNQPRVQGMVVNMIESIGSQERNMLKSSYPNVDFERCVIFEEGRAPADMMKLLIFLGGGGACILIGAILLLIPLFKR